MRAMTRRTRMRSATGSADADVRLLEVLRAQPQPLLEGHGRAVAESLGGERDVGLRVRHVAGTRVGVDRIEVAADQAPHLFEHLVERVALAAGDVERLPVD